MPFQLCQEPLYRQLSRLDETDHFMMGQFVTRDFSMDNFNPWYAIALDQFTSKFASHPTIFRNGDRISVCNFWRLKIEIILQEK